MIILANIGIRVFAINKLGQTATGRYSKLDRWWSLSTKCRSKTIEFTKIEKFLWGDLKKRYWEEFKKQRKLLTSKLGGWFAKCLKK